MSTRFLTAIAFTLLSMMAGRAANAQDCTSQANGYWDLSYVWSCPGTTNPPVDAWGGSVIYIDNTVGIANNETIDLTGSSVTKVVISGTLQFYSNSQLLLPAGCEVVLEDGAQIKAGNNSAKTLILIGGNGIWGRFCEADGCTNGTLTGPGTMDENSDPNNPLPVDLISFTAKNTSRSVILSWATASESDNSHFVVERASSDLQFEEIGKVNGAGDSDVLLNYSFADNTPLSGSSYYRLVQVDFDGDETPTRAIAIHADYNHPGVKLFPNPSQNGAISLEYYHPELSRVDVKYMDTAGRVVFRESIDQPIGTRLEVGKDLSLEKGVYEVHIQLDNLVYVKRLLVN